MKKLSRILTMALAVCMLLSVSVFAGNKSTAAAQQENTNYNLAEKYMIDQGIFQGDGSGNYHFSGYVKRGALAVLLVRAFNQNSNAGGNSQAHRNGNGNFRDVPTGSYYYEAIATLKASGIAKGDGTNFKPESYVTLHQAILLATRYAVEMGKDQLTGNADNLSALFENRTVSEYATRGDIAVMLYYMLTGNQSDGTAYGGSTAVNTAIEYTAVQDTAVHFDSADFSAICEKKTGDTLSHVLFTLPSASSGTLYDQYGTASQAAATADTAYQMEYNPNLSDLSFVPAAGFTGTVSIGYTAYSTTHASYTGTIEITFTENS